MKALVYRRSVLLYLLDMIMGRVNPHSFYPSLVPLRLAEVPFSPPSDSWVVLRNRLCGICGSDLSLLRGSESFILEPYASFPAILGHEIVAEVVSAPEGSGWKHEDRVVVEPILSCEQRGIPSCAYCSRGEYNLCENFTTGRLSSGSGIGYNRSAGGGMAEFSAADPRRLVRVPDHVPDEDAVLVESLSSALQPILDNMPEAGSKVIVYGAGIIGQHIVRILRAMGCSVWILMATKHPFQQKLAMAGGADLVLMSPDLRELGEAVSARSVATRFGGGNLEGGADIFFDCVGNTRSLQHGINVLRTRGKYVMVATAGRIGRVDMSSLSSRELCMVGTFCCSKGNYKGRTVRTFQIAMDLLASGTYPVDGLVTHVQPLQDYANAFAIAIDKRRHMSMKVVLDPKQNL
jgi:threonine dehydrogenase-like Zn-dependent dehydrogenase